MDAVEGQMLFPNHTIINRVENADLLWPLTNENQ